MTTWHFLKDESVSGPFNLEQSNQFILQHRNANLYAWNKNYTHWMPISHIEEFDSVVSIPKPPEDIPLSLFEDFITEEKELVDNLSRVETTLANVLMSFNEFNIDSHIKKTQSLNTQVQATIRSIQEQFESLQKSLETMQED